MTKWKTWHRPALAMDIQLFADLLGCNFPPPVATIVCKLSKLLSTVKKKSLQRIQQLIGEPTEDNQICLMAEFSRCIRNWVAAEDMGSLYSHKMDRDKLLQSLIAGGTIKVIVNTV